MNNTLLPSGLMDVLPPLAAQEFRLVHHFLKTFTGFGYQAVIPPLAEYTKTLLADQGEATSHHVFQVNDPRAGQMLAIRADMTGQVARIAATSLSAQKRPLRLCYAGYTLRTTAEALKTRRQHTQVGIERFGDTGVHATAEVLAIACHALHEVVSGDLSIDLHYPAVMEALLKDYPKDQHKELRDAVRLKDAARLKTLKADRLAELLHIAGPSDAVLKQLASAKEQAVKDAADELSKLCDALKKQKVDAALTIDLLDLSGYGYYNGVGYAMFWSKGGIEVGRGGCYPAGKEDAVGFTLYINDLLEELPAEKAPAVKKIPYGTSTKDAAKLQEEGYVTIFAEKA